MQNMTIWHNPRCSKSREAMTILEENKCEAEIVNYLESKPNRQEIKSVLKMLGLSARELMRTKEDIYKELNLSSEESEEKLIEAMVNHPKLIERPIVIKDGKAVIGRPIENVVNLLEQGL